MTKILTGRCLCSAIQYRCGPILYPPTLCHCASCRRASGAHSVGWLTVNACDLAFTGDSPRVYVSSPGIRRTFCGRCGTPLTYQAASRSAEIDVTLCTLDEPGMAAPADHIWMQDAPHWDVSSGALPRHSQRRA